MANLEFVDHFTLIDSPRTERAKHERRVAAEAASAPPRLAGPDPATMGPGFSSGVPTVEKPGRRRQPAHLRLFAKGDAEQPRQPIVLLQQPH